MRMNWVVLFTLLSVEAYNSISTTHIFPFHKNKTDKFRPRVYNGVDIDIDQAPWQVMVYAYYDGLSNHGKVCGGTILQDDLIITTATCVPHNNVGVIVYGTSEDPTEYQPIGSKRMPPGLFKYKTFVHTNVVYASIEGQIYLPGLSLDMSIALIHLESPMQLEDGMAEAIALPRRSPQVGHKVIVSGWGQPGWNMYQKLTATELMITSKSPQNRGMVARGQVGVWQMPSNACSVDEGGPVVCDYDSPRRRNLCGIIIGNDHDACLGQSYLLNVFPLVESIKIFMDEANVCSTCGLQ